MKRLIPVFCFFIFIINALSAQSLLNHYPPSYSSRAGFEGIAKVDIARPDEAFINRAEEHSGKDELYVISQLMPVNYNAENSGTWTQLENGTPIWRLEIRGEDAKALALHFDRFNLPEGAQLYVYDGDRTQLLGGYNHKDNAGDKAYSIGLILGESIIIEYVAPQLLTPGNKKAIMHTENDAIPDIQISAVSYIFRGVEDLQDAKDIGDAGACEVNINCPEGDNWQTQKKGVVRIYVVEGSQGGWCSGTLINNLTNDGTPYILTANHCGPNASAANFNQWMFYFHLEYTACQNTTQATSHTSTGCTMRAFGSMGGGSDFYLLELNNRPDNSWNVIYNGWRRDNTASPSGVCIHHPAGDVKKISTYTSPLQTASYTGCAPNAHWGVGRWVATQTNEGVTEGGSSGSPIFDNNGYVVGTLTGGASSCGYPNNDYYGKIFYHWDQNGSSDADKLQPWLDPNNTGNTTCDLFDPNDPDDPGNPPQPGNCRTLHYPLAGTLTLYRMQERGYLSGNNNYNDLAKADFFTKDTVVEYVVNMSVNIGHISGTTGDITFCIWDNNNGVPGNILGSKTVPVSTVMANLFIEHDPAMTSPYESYNRRYLCDFNTGIEVSGDFFAGVILPTTAEIAIVTNTDGDGANTGWEMNSDSTWSSYTDTWGISLTNAIFPHLCDNQNSNGITDNQFENNISIYPNPTTGITTIEFKEPLTQPTHITIYDITGKILQVEKEVSENMITVDLHDFPNGMYFVAIQTPEKMITRKITLIK